MPVRPGGILVVIGATSLVVDDISVTEESQFFDRSEFDHEVLRTAPLANGATPLYVQLLGGKQAEIAIGCVIPDPYTARPLTPNSYPTDWDNIKQKIKKTSYRISGGKTAESANLASSVDAVFAVAQAHIRKQAQFDTRVQIASSGRVSYEQLLSFQSDNLQTLYFTTGISFSGPGVTFSDAFISSFTYGIEYVIRNDANTGVDIYKGFDLVIEQRTVQAASTA